VDAGVPDAGPPPADAGDPGNACGNCLPDAGATDPVDAGTAAGNGSDGGIPSIPVNDSTLAPSTGCSSSGAVAGWLALGGLLALVSRKQRRKVAD
jgi:uncharacterized protein (TIGR03382 family)